MSNRLLLSMFLVTTLWTHTRSEYNFYTNKLKVVVKSLETPHRDAGIVGNFSRVAPDSNVYILQTISAVPSLFIDILASTVEPSKVLYQLKDMDGCAFFDNLNANRIMCDIYKRLLGNDNHFSCPIAAGNYYIRDVFNADVMPPLHPPGNFVLHVKLKGKRAGPAIFSLLWRYRVTRRN